MESFLDGELQSRIDGISTPKRRPRVSTQYYDGEIAEAKVRLRTLERRFSRLVPFSLEWHKQRREIRVTRRELAAMEAAREKMKCWNGRNRGQIMRGENAAA